MRVDTPKKGQKPKVTEVLGTQNYDFKRPTSPPAVPPNLRHAVPQQGRQDPPIPPGHPGYAKLQAQAQPNFTRQTEGTEKSYSEIDPTFVSVDLPSLFELYPFKKIALRPLLGVHIAKFNRAQKEESMRHIVDAISSTLEPGISAYDLQPADFYYLMYWQRVNSYPKSPMLVEVWCTDKKHNLEVIEGVMDEEGKPVLDPETQKPLKKDKETLHLEEIVNMTTLDVKNRAPLDLSMFKELDEKYGLGYETIGDVVEVTEKVVESEDGLPEFSYLAGKAAFLAKGPGRTTLDERCKIVENMTPDELALLDQYVDVVTDFGVAESTDVKCKDCGALTRVNISFNALTFLPGGR